MKSKEKQKLVTIPVENLLNLIEEATARGMQRGAQLVIEMTENAPVPQEPQVESRQGSLFIGDLL